MVNEYARNFNYLKIKNCIFIEVTVVIIEVEFCAVKINNFTGRTKMLIIIDHSTYARCYDDFYISLTAAIGILAVFYAAANNLIQIRYNTEKSRYLIL